MSYLSSLKTNLVPPIWDIILPASILIFLSDKTLLGTIGAFIVAVLFPLTHALVNLWMKESVKVITAIAICSILLTSLIFIKQIEPQYLALKEAAVPVFIGFILIVLEFTRYPIARLLFLSTIDKDAVSNSLTSKSKKEKYKRLLNGVVSTLICTMFISGILNYVLARAVVISMPGTVEFNQELGRMIALSFPVIGIPTATILLITEIIFLLILKNITDLNLSDILCFKTKF